jgi:hypothetical protein
MGENRNEYKFLSGKRERKRPLGRPRRKWEDKFKMDLREIGWEGMGWIYMAHDRIPRRARY